MKTKTAFGAVFLAIAFFLTINSAFAQTSAFNFQGRLNDNSNPANGRYDLQFKLFDAPTGGNQIAATVDCPNLLLVNGVFSTTLDFGAASFDGGNRFAENSVRPNGSPNAHVILGGRQPILSVPLAVRSATADIATNAVTAANFSGSLGGDVSGTQNATTVVGLQGRDVANTALLNDQVLKYNSSANQWIPGTDTSAVLF